MRTYKSTLNDLKRLNQLTKIGRNWSFPVEFPPLKLFVNPSLCSADPAYKCMRTQTMSILLGVNATRGSEIVFPAACPEPVWSVQPSPASGMTLGLACLSTPLPTLYKVPTKAWMGRRCNSYPAALNSVCPGDNCFKVEIWWVKFSGEKIGNCDEEGNNSDTLMPGCSPKLRSNGKQLTHRGRENSYPDLWNLKGPFFLKDLVVTKEYLEMLFALSVVEVLCVLFHHHMAAVHHIPPASNNWKLTHKGQLKYWFPCQKHCHHSIWFPFYHHALHCGFSAVIPN